MVEPRLPSGEEIRACLSAVRGGSEAGLGTLLEQHRGYLLAIANAEFPVVLAGKLAPSDLVQETLTRAWQGFDGFRGQTAEELAGWLRRILQNQLVTSLRQFEALGKDISREQRVPPGLEDRRQDSPSGAALSQEEQASLEAALSRLSGDYCDVIRLRHQENRSFTEIAETLGRTEQACRKLWARAVHQLRLELRADEREAPSEQGKPGLERPRSGRFPD